MGTRAHLVSVLLLMVAPVAYPQSDCPNGELWEPYTQVCADVRDTREDFPLSFAGAEGGLEGDMPVPGSMAVGTAYSPNQLVALDSGRLHTKMFVYPNGVSPDGPLPIFYTTATSRVNRGLELLVAYSDANPDFSRLNLYAWPCLPDYPCPDGETDPGWQWSRKLTELTCNITQVVDQGHHAQKQLYYANHTDRLDDASPPQWKSAIYLWNYCDAAWDLAWQHTYRQDKVDCSIPGAGCAWWGPSFEIFGDTPYPQIAELGYEDSLLYHDGVWSELRPDEAGFRDPARWAPTTPWQLFHLEPNRSYGVGNFLNDNDAPVIERQLPLDSQEDEPLAINTDSLVISDPDVDLAYHVAYELTLHSGGDYTITGQTLLPAANFAGKLTVPITVSDGAADSQVFNLMIEIIPVNDAPVITGQNVLETTERTPLEITLVDLSLEDIDSDAGELSIIVQDGADYVVSGNTITPAPGFIGELSITIVASDQELESEPFALLVAVIPDRIPPDLTLAGSPSAQVNLGSHYQDPGATAFDNVDGDISDRIVVDNPVDTSRIGNYTIIYTVTDLAGNGASITRTVIVKAAEIPVVKRRSGGGSVSLLSILVLLLLVFRVGQGTFGKGRGDSRF